ncbi:DUF5776 domain-containing protein [Lentilactobacillus sp. Marseille-Q4993]|uniref:DUF5776 domain-containing protein n=1 Tax=Lentilactobacillus sp. Marseille-Q4993 TaxID=3039492 RepID=UPI0024BC02AD|nr:DUF5776 domain-containing protein [Lentilactobacillus sp. Marseille-Q4993]
MNIKRILWVSAAILGGAVSMGTVNAGAQTSTGSGELVPVASQATVAANDDYNAAIKSGVNYINNTADNLGDHDAWDALAISRSPQGMTSEQADAIYDNLETDINHDHSTITTLERDAIGMESVGGDPESVLVKDEHGDDEDFDMIQAIMDGTKDEKNNYETSIIYGIIALSANDYDDEGVSASIQSLVKQLVAKQETGGTWNYFGRVDMTGMALQALAMHQDQPGVKDAIEKAETAIKDKLYVPATGGFLDKTSTFGKTENSNSNAMIVAGLASCGVDVTKGLTEGGKSPLAGLLSFQQKDGSFMWQHEQAGAVVMATQQSVYALDQVAYTQTKKGSIFDFANNERQVAAGDKDKMAAVSALVGAAEEKQKSVQADTKLSDADKKATIASVTDLLSKYTVQITNANSAEDVAKIKNEGLDAIKKATPKKTDETDAVQTAKLTAISTLVDAAKARQAEVIADSKMSDEDKTATNELVNQLLSKYTVEVNEATKEAEIAKSETEGVAAIKAAVAKHTEEPSNNNDNNGNNNQVVNPTPSPITSNGLLGGMLISVLPSSTDSSTTPSQDNSNNQPTKVTEPTPVTTSMKYVLGIKEVNLFSEANLTNMTVSYAKASRNKSPMFKVIGMFKNSNNDLVYQLKNTVSGDQGYVLNDSNVIVNAYYTKKATQIKVINPKGVNQYASKNLTHFQKHHKKGAKVKVSKVVKLGDTTRFVLKNGGYITANKKLVSEIG